MKEYNVTIKWSETHEADIKAVMPSKLTAIAEVFKQLADDKIIPVGAKLLKVSAKLIK